MQTSYGDSQHPRKSAYLRIGNIRTDRLAGIILPSARSACSSITTPPSDLSSPSRDNEYSVTSVDQSILSSRAVPESGVSLLFLARGGDDGMDNLTA